MGGGYPCCCEESSSSSSHSNSTSHSSSSPSSSSPSSSSTSTLYNCPTYCQDGNMAQQIQVTVYDSFGGTTSCLTCGGLTFGDGSSYILDADAPCSWLVCYPSCYYLRAYILNDHTINFDMVRCDADCVPNTTGGCQGVIGIGTGPINCCNGNYTGSFGNFACGPFGGLPGFSCPTKTLHFDVQFLGC